ncbi:MAG: PqqD family protein [Desulfobacteraceae bacterium]|nr:MAG: PqqD family protein [Desulfobacteraceae bacterium]
MTEVYVIPDDAVIKKRVNSVTRLLEGKAIIIQNGNPCPFQLNEAGTKIWAWMDCPRQKNELIALLCAAYQAEKNMLVADLDFFLAELFRRNLIETDC